MLLPTSIIPRMATKDIPFGLLSFVCCQLVFMRTAHVLISSSLLGKVIKASANTSNKITSLLALLASSLSNGQPLPPYIQMPQTFELVRSLEHIDPDIVSIRHIAEPEYSAFAVMQVTSQCINTDVRKLVK